MKLGSDRVTAVNISGTGKNALDFHLAFYLGEILTQSPATRCVIISKDKGFAPLVRHLKTRKFDVEQAETFPTKKTPVEHQAAVDDAAYTRARESLAKGKKARPRKRSTLQTHLKNILNGKCSDEQIPQIVEQLILDGVVRESGGSLSYPD